MQGGLVQASAYGLWVVERKEKEGGKGRGGNGLLLSKFISIWNWEGGGWGGGEEILKEFPVIFDTGSTAHN